VRPRLSYWCTTGNRVTGTLLRSLGDTTYPSASCSNCTFRIGLPSNTPIVYTGPGARDDQIMPATSSNVLRTSNS